MATRLNITVPDELYQRLERVRDRINASKVCAQALEREIDMIESKPAVVDPDVQRAIQRLQTTADKWRERGARDGRTWALNQATRDDFQDVTQHPKDKVDFPASFNAEARLNGWVDFDTMAEMAFWDLDHDHRTADKATEPSVVVDRAFEEMQCRKKNEAQLDRVAYAKGWQVAVQEAWDLIRPALQV